MAVNAQVKMVPRVLNRALDATITASETPLNTKLTDMNDARRGVSTVFQADSVNVDFDIGLFGPQQITFCSVYCPGLSIGATVAFQSKLLSGDSYTTQKSITLFTRTTTDGADGFGADERGADEFPDIYTRRYPSTPPYYVLLASPVDHRFWRIAITDTDARLIQVSCPIIAQAWEAPTGYGLTSRITRRLIDDSAKTRSKSGADAINPGVQRTQFDFEFEHFQSAEAWKTLAFLFEEHGTRDPFFVVLRSVEDAANVGNTTDATGYEMLRNMVYGTFDDIPSLDLLAGRGTANLSILGFTITESL
jgi:hypothetical protein